MISCGIRGRIMLHCCPKENVNIVFYYLYFSILRQYVCTEDFEMDVLC